MFTKPSRVGKVSSSLTNLLSVSDMTCMNLINSSGSWVRPTIGKHWPEIGRREGGTLGHLFAQLATSLNQKIRAPSKQPFLHNFLSLFILLLCLVTKLCSILVWPLRLLPARFLCPWDFPGKNTGVCCHFLLQGIFLTQGLNPRLLLWQVVSFPRPGNP